MQPGKNLYKKKIKKKERMAVQILYAMPNESRVLNSMNDIGLLCL